MPCPDIWVSLRAWDARLVVLGMRPRTRRAYRYALLRLMADLYIDLEDLTEPMVLSYLAGLAPAWRAQVLKALRSYFDEAEANPVARLTPKQEKYTLAPDLADEALTRLVVALAWREPRRAWAVLLVYGTGARIGSVVALRGSDIWGGEAHFMEAKGGRTYAVPLGSIAKEAVAELRAMSDGGRLLGVGRERFRQWIRQAVADAGLERVWPHLLRHAFSNRIARATDPRTWQALMGHADLSQYSRYVRPEEDRMRKAVEAL